MTNAGRMKIVIDNKIPYIKGALEPFADVVYLPGGRISHEDVKDADAIITRTRTKCNEALLKGSGVKFIATATIGFDHIDTEYCREADIGWTNAPGCNAESVNQYIASALFSYSLRNEFVLKEKTIGIVGVGHVGSKVAHLCRTIGMKVLLNDPPRERKEGSREFVPLQKIREEADIITFHVPLNMKGRDATYHMVNNEFLSGLGKNPLLINSCRGEVFETEPVKNAVRNGIISGLIVDCWKNEPEIDLELLDLADYGTSHIAGYSRDGKANGTAMSVRAVSKFFNLGIGDWKPGNVEMPEKTVIEIKRDTGDEYNILADAVLSSYSIENDDKALRISPGMFEKLREEYPVRREFGVYTVIMGNMARQTKEKLKKMGFNIKESGTLPA